MDVPADVSGYGNPCSSFKDMRSFQPNAITASSQLWSGTLGSSGGARAGVLSLALPGFADGFFLSKKMNRGWYPLPAAVSGKAVRHALTLLGFATLHGTHCARQILVGLRFTHFQICLKKF